MGCAQTGHKRTSRCKVLLENDFVLVLDRNCVAERRW